MIRINLLGTPKPRSKRGAASMPDIQVGGISPLFKAVAVVAMVGILNAGYWYRLDKEKQKIAEQMTAALRKNQELSQVKARYLERQRQAEMYKRRVDVIDQLRANQTGPVNLLNMMGTTVNGTEAVWLNTMKDQGATIEIEGLALSQDSVANLITNLQKTGYFKAVEIKETYQDDTIKDMQAFLFTLSCEKLKS
jgi:type IV pilus assembly protein PilN